VSPLLGDDARSHDAVVAVLLVVSRRTELLPPGPGTKTRAGSELRKGAAGHRNGLSSTANQLFSGKMRELVGEFF
jgi:hypothetical protein